VAVGFFRDRHGAQSLDIIGEDNVLFEVDYPHTDSTWPDTKKIAEQDFTGLSPQTIYKIVRATRSSSTSSTSGEGVVMQARALIAREFGAPAKIETIDVVEPAAGEVRVKIVASGVCGSDGHILRGASTAVRLPTVLGHEGAGVVESIGAGVDNIQVGDHVVIGLSTWCGECYYCTSGQAWLCDSKQRMDSFYGIKPDGRTRVTAAGEPIYTMLGVGTLAEYALAPARQVVAVDPALPLDELCLIGCGVTTGVGAALHTAKVTPGDSVAVIGCGGVGLSVVQGSRIAGARTIIAIDQVPRKLALAEELGATYSINSTATDVRQAVLDIAGRGVDYAFEVVGNPTLVTLALKLVRTGGTAIVVGISPPGSEISFQREWLMGERRLMTSMGGSTVAALGIPKLVQMVTKGQLRLSDMVDRRIPLDRVDEAFAALASGEVARSVVTFT
jgi:S-(hydroxymethyl)glutathione dehydrogenase/alcohol dehydrogenase